MYFSQNLKTKKNIIFYQATGLSLFFWLLFLAAIVKLYPKLFFVWHSLLDQAEVFCGCSTQLSWINNPKTFASLIGISFVLAGLVGFIVFKIIKIKSLTHKFVSRVLQKQNKKMSVKLRAVSQELKIENNILEIESQRPLVFCFGFWRPKICVSSVVTQVLNQEELSAVLTHEKAHLIDSEPLKIFILKIIATSLFFLPVLKQWLQEYLILSELSADQEATSDGQNKSPLVNSLAKIMALQDSAFSAQNLALSFFAITDERINKLADDNYLPKITTISSSLFVSLFSLMVFIGLLVGLFGFGQPVAANDFSSQVCYTMDEDVSVGCDKFFEKNECVKHYGVEYSISWHCTK